MRKLMRPLVCMLGFFSACFGQPLDFIYKNDFTERNFNDQDSYEYDRSSYMKDGHYFFEKSKQTGFWFFVEKFFIDPAKDYEIEIKMQPYDYADNAEFGIIFGGKHTMIEEKINSFVMNPDGKVRISSWADYKIEPHMDWKKKMPPVKKDEWYIFKIKLKDGKQQFYINNTLTYEGTPIEFHDRWFGWYIDGIIGIKVDYFYIKQARGAIKPSAEYAGKNKERAKGSINSSSDEIYPTLSKDGKELFFGRVFSKTGYFIMNDGYPSMQKCAVDSTGKTGISKKVKGSAMYPLWSPWYIASTPDANGFYCEGGAGYGSAVNNNLFYHTNNEAGGFDQNKSYKFPPLEITVKHASMSKDGKTMVISGFRRYEPKGLELYVSKKNAEGWSKPEPIASLNTNGDELTPFISGDMKKLYFSSDGHPGYGYSDVFVCTRLDDTWQNWSAPENLGEGINDMGCNLYFSLPDTGDYAYLSSNSGHIHNLDIFRVKVDRKKEPLVLKGKIIYEDGTSPPLNSIQLVYENKTFKKEKIVVDPATNTFSTKIKEGEKYTIQLPDSNYIIIAQKTIPGTAKPNEKLVELMVKRLKKGESFVLENIYFSPNKTDLLPASFPSLDILLSAMQSNPDLKIEVQGHTSRTNEGEAFNQELSSNRAAAIKTYLVGKGIQETRIRSKGYGYSKPIYTDDLEEHQAKNRRVEIKIL
jgi:OmpA-OmpF porin, OOP family